MSNVPPPSGAAPAVGATWIRDAEDLALQVRAEVDAAFLFAQRTEVMEVEADEAAGSTVRRWFGALLGRRDADDGADEPNEPATLLEFDRAEQGLASGLSRWRRARPTLMDASADPYRPMDSGDRPHAELAGGDVEIDDEALASMAAYERAQWLARQRLLHDAALRAWLVAGDASLERAAASSMRGGRHSPLVAWIDAATSGVLESIGRTLGGPPHTRWDRFVARLRRAHDAAELLLDDVAAVTGRSRTPRAEPHGALADDEVEAARERVEARLRLRDTGY
jgi:hypothetical protein